MTKPTLEAAAPLEIIRPVQATAAALSANLVGIGLARFGYTPLIPVLVAQGWFAPSTAAYLGAANLAGHLAGALGARILTTGLGVPRTLRGAMLLTAASLIACAFPWGFAWFFAWRFLSGCTGGVLMASAAPTVIATIPAEKRGVAGGAIFTGVGLGIAASGTLVPLLIRWGLRETWLGLGAISLALTALTWKEWPAPAPTTRARERTAATRSPALLKALYLEYALCAVGLVPHMVFLVDFISRGLARGLEEGALFWIIFGVGAVIGPLIAGYIGGRLGFRATLRMVFLIQATAVAIPLVTATPLPLALSSFLIGAFVPGIVAVTIGRTRELLHHDPEAQAHAWSYCTAAFALGQAVAGYAFSFIFAQANGGYMVLFALGTAAFILALALDIGASIIAWMAPAEQR